MHCRHFLPRHIEFGATNNSESLIFTYYVQKSQTYSVHFCLQASLRIKQATITRGENKIYSQRVKNTHITEASSLEKRFSGGAVEQSVQ